MNTAKQSKYTAYLALVLLLTAVCLSVPQITMSPVAAYADSNTTAFDSTNVLDDLRSDKNFDIRDYPFDESKGASVVSFTEYCYSYKTNMQTNYSLYLTVYNPQGLNIDTSSPLNRVQLATSYSGSGEPNDYAKFNLEYCNKSTESNYYGLFFKFRISLTAEDKTGLLSRLNSNERRYDISGIELLTVGNVNAKEYFVSRTYYYTGYAAGYGSDSSAGSTLKCNYSELETISLDVKHTYYRPEGTVSATENTMQNQLNSVYFAVPNKYFEKYGDIYAIKAEWYEYRTQPVFVTGNSEVYNGLSGYIGQNISSKYDSGTTASKAVNYGLAVNRYSNGGASEYAYNILDPINNNTTVLDTLHYLFKANSGNADDYTLSGDAVKDFAYARRGGETDLINGKYPKRYFTNNVGSGRTAGYNVKTIKSTDEYTMSGFVLGDSWFERSWRIGTTTEYGNIQAIKRLTDTDIKSSAAETAKSLYIAEDDYADLKAYNDTANRADSTTVLFRFAISDYYSAETYNCKFIWFFGDKTNLLDTNAYMAMQNVFLDFDIIHLEFKNYEQVTVIPVVSNPIDIFSDMTPPVNTTDDGLAWWAWLIIIGVIILILLILLPVIPSLVIGIFKFVWFIVSLPFKLIYKFFKVIFGRRRDDG